MLLHHLTQREMQQFTRSFTPKSSANHCGLCANWVSSVYITSRLWLDLTSSPVESRQCRSTFKSNQGDKQHIGAQLEAAQYVSLTSETHNLCQHSNCIQYIPSYHSHTQPSLNECWRQRFRWCAVTLDFAATT